MKKNPTPIHDKATNCNGIMLVRPTDLVPPSDDELMHLLHVNLTNETCHGDSFRSRLPYGNFGQIPPPTLCRKKRLPDEYNFDHLRTSSPDAASTYEYALEMVKKYKVCPDCLKELQSCLQQNAFSKGQSMPSPY